MFFCLWAFDLNSPLVCILILKNGLQHVLNERKTLKKYMRNILLLLKPVKGAIYVTRILLLFQVNPLLKSLLSAFTKTKNDFVAAITKDWTGMVMVGRFKSVIPLWKIFGASSLGLQGTEQQLFELGDDCCLNSFQGGLSF